MQVVELKTTRVGHPDNDDIIERLEVMLDKAKRGELGGVAYAYVSGSKQTTGWRAHKGEESHLGMSIMRLGWIYARDNSEDCICEDKP